ncbi:MAG: hypothetical protein ACFFBP_05430 [Promethearchaeota archaeon]
MVQFKIGEEHEGDYTCDDCRSFIDGFCYRWSFPIQSNHIPCTKFKYQKKIEEEIDLSTTPNEKSLLQDFFRELRKANKEIDGKSYLEIYTTFDELINKYAQRLL